MGKPKVVVQIEEIIGNNIQLHEAPVHPDVLTGLMIVKNGQAKYAMEEEELIGLNLAGVGLSNGQWRDIVKEIKTENLQALNLSGNKLESLEVGAGFVNLKQLEVCGNEGLSEIEILVGLQQLERLVLRDNKLNELKLSGDFKSLKHLDASRNSLTEVSFEGDYSQMIWLEISKNNLANLTIPLSLKGLQYLFASNSGLKRLQFETRMEHLEILNLKENNFDDQIDNWFNQLTNNCVLYLNGNPLNTQMESNIKDDEDAYTFLEDYLRGRKGGVADNEYKMMVVGNGTVGKSSLIDRLVYNEFKKNRESTHAIRFVRYEDTSFPYVLNIWDFGGQSLYHATHRLFLQSNCLYLICWENKTEQFLDGQSKEGKTPEGLLDVKHPLSYWVHYVNYFGKGSPVIVSQTRMNEGGAVDPPRKAALLSLYTGGPENIQFEHIDSEPENDNGFELLKLKIELAIRRMNRSTNSDGTWLTIRQKLYELQQHIREADEKGEETTALKKTDLAGFNKLIESFELKVNNPLYVLNWLNETGVVFFKEGMFNNEILIDQEWAIKAIYTIFKRDSEAFLKFSQADGRFTGEDLNQIWEKDGYTVGEQQLFVDFMKTCELCFEIEDQEKWQPFIKRQFIAPQLLQTEKPKSARLLDRIWEKESVSQMLFVKYSFNYLHEGIIQHFIVKTHRLAKLDDIWRNGIILNWEDETVLVEAVGKDILIQTPSTGIALLQNVKKVLDELFKTEVEAKYSLDGVNFRTTQEIAAFKGDKIYFGDGTSALKRDFDLFENGGIFREKQLPLKEHNLSLKEIGAISEKLPIGVTKTDDRKKPKLTFFTAKVLDENEVNWEKEWSNINTNSFDHKIEKETTKNKILDIIEAEEPDIVHFSLHGDVKNGKAHMYILSENGDKEILNEDALFNELLDCQSQLGITPTLFVFNVCHCAPMAKKISGLGIHCIGFEDVVKYDCAREFSSAFYENYVFTKDVKKAFRSAVRAATRLSDPDIKRFAKIYHNGVQI